MAPELGPEPADIRLDRLDELGLLLRGVGVVKAKIELAVVLLRQTVV